MQLIVVFSDENFRHKLLMESNPSLKFTDVVFSDGFVMKKYATKSFFFSSCAHMY